MANYTRTQNFTVKDSLDSGDAEKIISGTDVDGELNAIATAIASKAESTFESGVKMVFVGASAPSGWSLVTTYDDRVLIIQNAAGESTAGNWSVSGTELAAATTGNVPDHSHNTGNHTHTINANHNHAHNIAVGNPTGSTHIAGLQTTTSNPAVTMFATGGSNSFSSGNVQIDFANTGDVTASASGVGTSGNPNGSPDTGGINDNNVSISNLATALSGTMVNGNYRPAYVNSFICSKN
jgi:hypothetical protein|tara:strand:- start:583 stop:1296 length:714 start_codon:yes stop_codon:yes gene_type:complete